jgi:uncharacterized membrane protein YqjE
MATKDLSFSDLMKNIVADVQDLVRSEFRLAKTELREEAAGFKSPALLLGAGAITALFAVFFMLYALVYALAMVLPQWAAALIVAVLLAAAGAITLRLGVKRLKRVSMVPYRTIASVKEVLSDPGNLSDRSAH